jgi:hypothetical protein
LKVDENKFINSLLDCWTKTNKYVVISLSSNNSHACLIIIDKQAATMEYFDPNYQTNYIPENYYKTRNYFLTLCTSILELTFKEQEIINYTSIQEILESLVCFLRILKKIQFQWNIFLVTTNYM